MGLERKSSATGLTAGIRRGRVAELGDASEEPAKQDLLVA